MPKTASAFLYAAILLCLGGCNTVSSYGIADYGDAIPGSQSSGTYFLPKDLIRVAIAADNSITVGTVVVKDTASELQAGFRLSAFAADEITIKYRSTGFLEALTSNNTDKTSEILVNIATLAGRVFRTAAVNSSSDTFYEFDPFNYEEARQVNLILRLRYGSCVEVEVMPNSWSPGCGEWSLGPTFAPGQVAPVPPLPTRTMGIFYRRALPYRVHVVERSQNKQITTHFFSNWSRIFRVDVNRRAFVSAQTTINFDDRGELTAVTVNKPSEALEISALPIKILTGFVNGTAAALTGQTSIIEARTKLLNAEASRAQAQAALLKALAANAATTGRSATAGDAQAAGVVSPSRAKLEACANAGVDDPVVCAALSPPSGG